MAVSVVTLFISHKLRTVTPWWQLCAAAHCPRGGGRRAPGGAEPHERRWWRPGGSGLGYLGRKGVEALKDCGGWCQIGEDLPVAMNRRDASDGRIGDVCSSDQPVLATWAPTHWGDPHSTAIKLYILPFFYFFHLIGSHKKCTKEAIGRVDSPIFMVWIASDQLSKSTGRDYAVLLACLHPKCSS